MCADRQRGFTLLELVVTLVILGVAFAAIAGLVGTLGGGSASPVLQTQALYIAEGYLEEAMLKAYSDPDGIDEGSATSRDLWDDVVDYRRLDTAAAPTDSTGVGIPGLSRYRVRMTVGEPVTVGGATTRRVEVQVSNIDGDFDVRLAALKAQY
jgi:MSHA pilin protein MshD